MATSKKKDDFDDEKHSGKRPNQKLKPYLVLQILMEHTDEEHVLCAAEIVDYLDEMGIFAERRSIYTDIDEIFRFSIIVATEPPSFLSCVFNGFRALVRILCGNCAEEQKSEKSKSLNKYKNTADFEKIGGIFGTR